MRLGAINIIITTIIIIRSTGVLVKHLIASDRDGEGLTVGGGKSGSSALGDICPHSWNKPC